MAGAVLVAALEPLLLRRRGWAVIAIGRMMGRGWAMLDDGILSGGWLRRGEGLRDVSGWSSDWRVSRCGLRSSVS